MQRSSASLLRFFHSQSVCTSNFNKTSISKIDAANYPLAFQGSVCQSFGFGQGVRCLASRADVLKDVHASVDEMKRGRWTCPKCQFTNSAHHQRCMGCLEPDSISTSRLPTFGFSLGADSQDVRKIGLPQSIVKFCVLRSPHIDKKSREQFEMRIKKLYMVAKTRPDDLQKKFFWLKRQRILGAQYETVFSCKTRLPLETRELKCP